MTKSKVWLSVLATGAAFSLLAYATTRRTSQAARFKAASADDAALPPRTKSDARVTDPAAEPRVIAAPTVIARLAVEPEPLSVHFLMKAPPLLGADDGDTLGADELAGDWLARAAQSEQSVSEEDLELDLDDIADPKSEAFSQGEDVPESRNG